MGVFGAKNLLKTPRILGMTKTAGSTEKSPPPASFEAAIAELEKITTLMERGELALEDSLASYRRGAELVEFCRQSLAKVEQQVKVLEADLLKPYAQQD